MNGLHLNLAPHIVASSSGGYSREDACRELAKNDGMIASFSRALLEVLQAKMDDQQFDQALGNAIEEIACASTGDSAGASTGA